MNPVRAIVRGLRGLLMGLVRLYQVTLSPLLPAACRFYPSCSEYALEALRKKPLPTAVGMILWRLARCQPFCKGGYDPVDDDPPARPQHHCAEKQAEP